MKLLKGIGHSMGSGYRKLCVMDFRIFP